MEVNKVLYNLDQSSFTSAAEKERARINIGIPPVSGMAGKHLAVANDLTLVWVPPVDSSVVKKKDYGDTSESNVSTLLIDSDDPDGYSVLKADSVNKGALVAGPYATLLNSGINGGSGKGDANTPIFADTDGLFKPCSAVRGGKTSNTAELYFYNTDDGDHYRVRGIKNYCVNHVAVDSHSGDICSVLIEAPTIAEGEEYDYAVIFDCTDSSGFCHVSVENCDAEIVKKPKLDTSTTPNTLTFDDVTETLVYFTGSPQFQVEVLSERWSLHRF